jgi:hypothetical protein
LPQNSNKNIAKPAATTKPFGESKPAAKSKPSLASKPFGKKVEKPVEKKEPIPKEINDSKDSVIEEIPDVTPEKDHVIKQDFPQKPKVASKKDIKSDIQTKPVEQKKPDTKKEINKSNRVDESIDSYESFDDNLPPKKETTKAAPKQASPHPVAPKQEPINKAPTKVESKPVAAEQKDEFNFEESGSPEVKKNHNKIAKQSSQQEVVAMEEEYISDDFEFE